MRTSSQQRLLLSASAKIAVSDAVKVTVGGGYNIKSEKISASAGVEYSAEKFTASADVSFSIKGETKTLVPTVVVSSDALINGATVELSWKGADFKTEKNGKINAQVKISL